MSEASPDELDSDLDGSGGSSDLPGSPNITSRLSLLKLGPVISKFSEFRKQLVRETGFDGMLQFKSWQKLNLKYSAYLMDRVDVDNSIINLEAQGMLELTENQVHSVFAIPMGKQIINSEGVDPSDACIHYTKFAATISDKGTHNLKAAEAYLIRDINNDSSKIEVECFKIAFVIFVVGHVLAPSTKHEYITVDFWAALNDVARIKDWNWCAYVLKRLIKAVRKFKGCVGKQIATIHIFGCHLFLQILVLDNLDMGKLNKPRGMYPRIALFDYDSMKRMIDFISINLGGGAISFHGASVRTDQNISKDIVCEADHHRPSLYRPSPATKRVQMTAATDDMTSVPKYGAQDFANHLRQKYPSISGEKMGILLREHNARGLANITEFRQSFQASMFTFTDKLISCIAENCTCCKAAGRNQCTLKTADHNNATATNVRIQDESIFQTPIANKFVSRLGQSFDNEARLQTVRGQGRYLVDRVQATHPTHRRRYVFA